MWFRCVRNWRNFCQDDVDQRWKSPVVCWSGWLQLTVVMPFIPRSLPQSSSSSSSSSASLFSSLSSSSLSSSPTPWRYELTVVSPFIPCAQAMNVISKSGVRLHYVESVFLSLVSIFTMLSPYFQVWCPSSLCCIRISKSGVSLHYAVSVFLSLVSVFTMLCPYF